MSDEIRTVGKRPIVGNVTVNGVELDVTADARSGDFVLFRDGDHVGRGPTLDAAKAKARIELKKKQVKVEVPFRHWDGRRGVADSLHATNGDVLYTAEDGSRDSLGRAYRINVAKPQTPDSVIEELDRLHGEIREREKRVGELHEDWGMNLTATVRAAIENAAAGDEN